MPVQVIPVVESLSDIPPFHRQEAVSRDYGPKISRFLMSGEWVRPEHRRTHSLVLRRWCSCSWAERPNSFRMYARTARLSEQVPTCIPPPPHRILPRNRPQIGPELVILEAGHGARLAQRGTILVQHLASESFGRTELLDRHSHRMPRGSGLKIFPAPPH